MNLSLFLLRIGAELCRAFGLEEQALVAYRRMLVGSQDAVIARLAALQAVKVHRLEEAESWYAKAASWAPEDTETWFNLGYLRDMRGRKREAIEAFRHAVRLTPHFANAWHAIGSMYVALGEHALAVEPLRKAHELLPQNAQALYLIGTCQHVLDNEQAVREAVRDLVKLDAALARKLVGETGRKALGTLLPQA